MVTNRHVGVSLLLVGMIVSVASIAEAAQDTTLIVVPSRYTIVQLAFDMAKIRNVDLVAYDPESDPADPVLHVWNDTLREWTRTTMQEYGAGDAFRSRPDGAVIIGTEDMLPPGLLDASKWIGDRTHVPTLDIVTLVNTLNTVFGFSKKEWKWLGQRYKLELKDLNEERRRYGRYGRVGDDRVKPDEAVPVPIVDSKRPVIIQPVPVTVEAEPEPDPLPIEQPKVLKDMKPTGKPMKASPDLGDVSPEDK